MSSADNLFGTAFNQSGATLSTCCRIIDPSKARANGVVELFCLSTQAFNYFVQKGGFRLGTPDDLPPALAVIPAVKPGSRAA